MLTLGVYGAKENFYLLRGVVEQLLNHLHIDVTIEVGGDSYYHPGRKALLKHGNDVVCTLGEIHPAVRERFELPARAWVAELNMQQLFTLARPMGAVKPMPRYPAVTRDLSLVMPEATQVGPLLASMVKAGGSILEDAQVFDVYRAPVLGSERKSVAFSFVFRSSDHTLTDAEVTKAVTKIIRVAAEEYGAIIRG